MEVQFSTEMQMPEGKPGHIHAGIIYQKKKKKIWKIWKGQGAAAIKMQSGGLERRPRATKYLLTLKQHWHRGCNTARPEGMAFSHKDPSPLLGED